MWIERADDPFRPRGSVATFMKLPQQIVRNRVTLVFAGVAATLGFWSMIGSGLPVIRRIVGMPFESQHPLALLVLYPAGLAVVSFGVGYLLKAQGRASFVEALLSSPGLWIVISSLALSVPIARYWFVEAPGGALGLASAWICVSCFSVLAGTVGRRDQALWRVLAFCAGGLLASWLSLALARSLLFTQIIWPAYSLAAFGVMRSSDRN
jgi:hypothetical protein